MPFLSVDDLAVRQAFDQLKLDAYKQSVNRNLGFLSSNYDVQQAGYGVSDQAYANRRDQAVQSAGLSRDRAMAEGRFSAQAAQQQAAQAAQRGAFQLQNIGLDRERNSSGFQQQVLARNAGDSGFARRNRDMYIRGYQQQEAGVGMDVEAAQQSAALAAQRAQMVADFAARGYDLDAAGAAADYQIQVAQLANQRQRDSVAYQQARYGLLDDIARAELDNYVTYGYGFIRAATDDAQGYYNDLLGGLR